MKKLKKIRIIETGRLDKFEMDELVGGIYSCTGSYTISSCDLVGSKSTSNCSLSYTSCAFPWIGNYDSCSSSYIGPTGPGGRN